MILFIAIDDLNRWVGYLGRNPQTKTPNIDRLAQRGFWFTRSYCAAPVCNPSRAALMSGLRPGATGVYENRNDWRYVRYAQGGEELYDEAADPYEWFNLADKPARAGQKYSLSKWLPKENKADIGGASNAGAEEGVPARNGRVGKREN